MNDKSPLLIIQCPTEMVIPLSEEIAKSFTDNTPLIVDSSIKIWAFDKDLNLLSKESAENA